MELHQRTYAVRVWSLSSPLFVFGLPTVVFPSSFEQENVRLNVFWVLAGTKRPSETKNDSAEMAFQGQTLTKIPMAWGILFPVLCYNHSHNLLKIKNKGTVFNFLQYTPRFTPERSEKSKIYNNDRI